MKQRCSHVSPQHVLSEMEENDKLKIGQVGKSRCNCSDWTIVKCKCDKSKKNVNWADELENEQEPIEDMDEDKVVVEDDEGIGTEPAEGQVEARPAMRRKVARPPTEEEVRRHRATHLPFRSWCPECIAGAANDWPHLRRTESEKLEVAEVHLDYCFPRDAIGGESVVVLVARDRETKMTTAHVVPAKGADIEWIAEQVCRDLLKFGHHGDLVLKSDQEPAITELLREVAGSEDLERQSWNEAPLGIAEQME